VIAKSLGADGVHYPSTFRNCILDKKLLITCSSHGYHDVKRIKQLYAKMVFISPIFLTNSNINKKARGIIKISFLANYIKTQYSVLGGIRESNIKLLRNRGINSISGLDFIFDITKYKC
jgi:thiamine monophosphate synthase